MWFIKRYGPAIVLLLAALLAFGGCAKNSGVVHSAPEVEPAPGTALPDDPESSRRYASELKGPPSYALFARSLDFAEKRRDVQFRRNENGAYQLYSAYAWNHFTIADAENNCLYDVTFNRLTSFQGLGGGYSTLLDLEITPGPCGISALDLKVEALDRLQNLEGAIISQKVLANMRKGTNFISDPSFLQDVLQVPWAVKSQAYGLEPYLARNLAAIEDPDDITFGDIVIFSEYIGEHTVGIYVGYGVIVCNCCFRTQVHRVRGDLEYRVYRLYSGFSLADYQIHQDSVLQQFLANPR